MMAHSQYLQRLMIRLREIREKKGIAPQRLEEILILGPGWVERFETAQVLPSLDTLVSVVGALGASLEDLVSGIPRRSRPSRYVGRYTPSSRARTLQ